MTDAAAREQASDARADARLGDEPRSDVRAPATPPGDAPDSPLAALGDLSDFRVAGDNADPRGWKVIAGDGRPIGVVAELIVDPAALKVRYLECRIDEDRRNVFVPVGFARLDGDRCEVLVDTLDSAGFARLAGRMMLPRNRTEQSALHAVFMGDEPADDAPHDAAVPDQPPPDS